ncbi:hypothetical protein ABLE68_10450 [Nocardioides sp. CN2-186]|uniref:hypothetical protein n=1 Tax=Nocardioides tweenelious TaxID=3156607 RepID=UPI0032B3F922
MNPKLTDDHVAGLPLHLGRADLLEEIMSTPVLDERPVRDERPRRRTTSWLVPAAAAVVVAALAVGSAWWASGGGPGSDGPTGLAKQPSAAQVTDRVALDAPGWKVVHVDETDGIAYAKGDLELEITDYPADSYDSYVEDRRHIVDPPADGAPVEVLGLGGQMWAYSPDDHTTIRQVQDGSWLEIRASGMDKAAYVALLDRLRFVDEATFEASLPDEFVGSSERSAAIDKIVNGIRDAAGTVFPMGSDATVESGQIDPYQLGADVVGQVACAWLSFYEDNRAAGDQDGIDEAVRVMGTSRDWPVLHQMNDTGDYPEVVWDYADRIAAGEMPEGYEGALGCSG